MKNFNNEPRPLGMPRRNKKIKTKQKTNRSYASGLALYSEASSDDCWFFKPRREDLKIDLELMTNCYVSIIEEAMKAGKYSVAKGAADSIVKMRALTMDKEEAKRRGEFDHLSDGELVELIYTVP